MRMVDLSNLYDKPIADETWEAIRREAPQLPREAGPEACRHFLSVLAHPARLDAILRDLHDTAVLERFVPAMAHARGLLQFNQYHKYTVDEHCLRAVGFTTKLMFDMGTLGRVYRQITEKHVLHLALLIHDLGKGHEEDHHVVGARIARQTAQRLGMPPREAETLEFLVKNHALMNNLAFRRDTGDQQLVVHFALRGRLARAAADAVRADGGRSGGGGARRVGPVEGPAVDRSARSHDGASGRREPGRQRRGPDGPPQRGPQATRLGQRAALVRAANRDPAVRLSQHDRTRADRRRSPHAPRSEDGRRRRRGMLPAGNRNDPVRHRHERGDHAGRLPQTHRRTDQPGPSDPLGPDQHAGRRPGARSLLGARSRLSPRAAAGSHRPRSNSP